MPYGRSWTKFLTFMVSAGASTLAGSQIVHNYYRPLADMDELVHQQVVKLKAEKGIVDDSLK